MRKYRFWIEVLFLAIFFCSSKALAWDDSHITEQEIRALPPYCQGHGGINGGALIPGKTPEQTRRDHNHWASVMGPGYEHFHHYCWGLSRMNRYYRHLSDPDRNIYLEKVIDDFTYTISKVPGTFRMLPEMLTARGKVFAMLNRSTEAIKDLQRAIKVNPKYEKSYATLADIFVKSGQSDVAREIINQGLKAVPNSKLLVKRSKSIGANAKQRESAK